jgi:hypothetical protein
MAEGMSQAPHNACTMKQILAYGRIRVGDAAEVIEAMESVNVR